MVITDWEDLQTLKWAQTVDPHQFEECELLLETYSMQVHLSHWSLFPPPPRHPFPRLLAFLLTALGLTHTNAYGFSCLLLQPLYQQKP